MSPHALAMPESHTATQAERTPAGSAGSAGLAEREELARVLQALATWFERFVYLPKENGYHLLALWTAHTWAIDQLATTPRLLLDSPVPESGKTTLLDHLEKLCRQPMKIGSAVSPALLARVVDQDPHTLLLDEVDRTLHPRDPGTPERLAILNTGYKRGGTRPVLVQKGTEWVAEVMTTFSPVAIAGNTPELPDDTRSRCIEVRLLPSLTVELEDSDWEEIEPDAQLLREATQQAVAALAGLIGSERPELPAGCRARNREKWLPLKRVAKQAGSQWEEFADQLISEDLESQAEAKEAGVKSKRPGVLLAEHLADYYRQVPGFGPSHAIAGWLIQNYPEAWGEGSSYGKALTVQRLGQMLSKSYGLTSQRVEMVRGYSAGQFQKIWNALGISKPAEPAEPAEKHPQCPKHHSPTLQGHCALCELEKSA